VQKQNLLHRINSTHWLAALASLLGGLLFFIQLVYFAHTQESVLDEGAYLYKGYLFVSGQYELYQPYGPWSNHMPLAFLVPGLIQVLFGPGIREGRYFAIFLAMLTLAGVWILARRFGNRWWAAAAIWILALNPMLTKMYSTAITQGLVIALLTWALVLILGQGRPLWQIVLGAVLGGLIFMTRVNMFLVLPALILYIFWDHGRKAGILSTLAGGLVVVIGHAIVWPDILHLWIILPRSLTPFLDAWRLPKPYEGIWQPDTSVEGRILSFFQIFRFHFAVMCGAIASWLLWPRSDNWKRRSDFRVAVSLSILLVILLALHMWFSLFGEYCVFCMPGYLGFFFVIGLVLFILTSAIWLRDGPGWRQWAVVVVVLVLSAGIGFSAFETIGEPLINLSIPSKLVGSSIPGYVTLGSVLTNKFGPDNRELRRLLPIFCGFLSGLALLVLVFIARKLANRPNSIRKLPYSYGYLVLVAFLIVGIVLSPTLAFAGGYTTYDCSGDVLLSYEASGEHLDRVIPDGSLVYWRGTLTAAPLLYVSGIRIFPAQINDGYSYIVEGDDSELLKRRGRWNYDLAREWASQADYVLIEQRSYDGWLKDFVLERDYQELEPSPPAVPCRANSQIRVFKNSDFRE